MEGRCFTSYDRQWIPRIRIARKLIAPDESDGNGTVSSQNLVEQENFNLVFWTESPSPTTVSIEAEIASITPFLLFP